ncbi:SGNH/GDSL hydrolase family protein [Niabella aquatica]
MFPFYVIGQQIDSSYDNWYYKQRMEHFKNTKPEEQAIVFLGNSITERGPWDQLLAGSVFPVINRGIGGDNSFGILARIDEVLRLKPKAIFLMDGINDQFKKIPYDISINNYRLIIKKIKTASPLTKIYIESALPINEAILTEEYARGCNKLVPAFNKKLKQLAGEQQVTYINICPLFQNKKGVLKAAFTMDGVHLKPEAYIRWVNFLKSKKYL